MKIFKNLKTAITFLSQDQKKKLNFFVILLFLSFFIETLSIGVLIPTLSIFISPLEFHNKFPLFNEILVNNYFKISVENFLLILIFLIFFLKFLFVTYLNYFNSNFSFEVQKYLSKKILTNYLNNPYNFFLNTNSSIILRNVIIEVEQFSVALIAYSFFLNEIILIFGIGIVLLIFQPKITIIFIILILIIIGIYNFFTIKIIKNLGLQRQRYEAERIKNVIEIIGLIKDIKLKYLYNFFLNIFDHNNSKAAHSFKWIKILQLFPRSFLEFFIVIVFLLICFIFIKLNVNKQEILFIGGIYLACAIKLLPSINRILSSFQKIKYVEPVIKNIKGEIQNLFKNFNNSEYQKIKNLETLEIQNIFFKYENDKFSGLKNITAEFKKNFIYGIVGPSGSGKSTLVNIICGFLESNSGNIYINKKLEINLKKLSSHIGYVPQDIFLLDGTVVENIALGETNPDKEKIKYILDKLDLLEFFINQPNGLNTYVGERGARLSGGQLQRLAIARALYKDPDILILDEFTSALDKENEVKILKYFEFLKKDKIVIISSHSENVKKICDKVYEIRDGTFYNKK
jgi:ABC-type multidrug transport system fused ATPase/permease subunit